MNEADANKRSGESGGLPKRTRSESMSGWRGKAASCATSRSKDGVRDCGGPEDLDDDTDCEDWVE